MRTAAIKEQFGDLANANSETPVIKLAIANILMVKLEKEKSIAAKADRDLRNSQTPTNEGSKPLSTPKKPPTPEKPIAP